MTHATTPSIGQGRKVRKVRGATRFVGIGSAAASLGVTRQHLFRVLTGERRSQRLTAAYQRHVRNQNQNQEAA